jgi:hypothetical protein
MSSVEEGVSGDGEELGFTCERLFVVLDAPPRFLIAAAAADLLSGTKRTETGFGYRELYAPLTASTPTPIGPPAIMAVPPVADTLLSTFTVWGTSSFAYCNRKIVPTTLHKLRGRDTFLSRGKYDVCSRWFARHGKLIMGAASDGSAGLIRTTGRHGKTLLINRSSSRIGKNISDFGSVPISWQNFV